MHRLYFIIVLLLTACAATAPVSEGEARINALAKERAKDERFPVLGPLPSRSEAVGEGLPAATRDELAEAAKPLLALTAEAAANGDGSQTAAVAGELRGLVAQLQRGGGEVSPPVDIEALGFPTPPPL